MRRNPFDVLVRLRKIDEKMARAELANKRRAHELARRKLEELRAKHTEELEVEDGNDLEALDRAMSAAAAETGRPTLVRVRTHIGYGAPNKQDTSGVHGSPLGPEEAAAAILDRIQTTTDFADLAGCDLVIEAVFEDRGIKADVTQKTEAVIDAEIPVMGHLGLTPQSVKAMGGYRVQGKEAQAAYEMISDAIALVDAGVFSIVLEGVPDRVAHIITAEVPVPTIGIGAGAGCDGQVLVIHDVLGLGGFHLLDEFLTEHRGHELGFVDAGEVEARNGGAVAQDGGAVAHRENLAEPMGDEQDRPTLLLPLPHHPKHVLGLIGRERCGDLVHQHALCVGCFEDCSETYWIKADFASQCDQRCLL